MTRARSLALIVADTNAVRRNISLEHGTRQLLNQCPMIPAKDLLDVLKVPCSVEHLNDLLDTKFCSDKKKRGHPSTLERKQKKRADLGNDPR